MDILGPELGPIVFQRNVVRDRGDFRFLDEMNGDYTDAFASATTSSGVCLTHRGRPSDIQIFSRALTGGDCNNLVRVDKDGSSILS